MVVERLHIEEPEPPAPEPEKTLDEVLDEHPISIQVNGEWQTFPNAASAEDAAYEEYKTNRSPKRAEFPILPTTILGEGGPKVKFQANINAIQLLEGAGGYRSAGQPGTAAGAFPLCGLGRSAGCL